MAAVSSSAYLVAANITGHLAPFFGTRLNAWTATSDDSVRSR